MTRVISPEEVGESVARAVAESVARVLGYSQKKLWGIEEIAFHTGYSERTVRDVLVKSKRFPKPVRLLQRESRWLPSEVENWWLERQEAG